MNDERKIASTEALQKIESLFNKAGGASFSLDSVRSADGNVTHEVTVFPHAKLDLQKIESLFKKAGGAVVGLNATRRTDNGFEFEAIALLSSIGVGRDKGKAFLNKDVRIHIPLPPQPL
ncbi:MAG: hypothetical protein JO108_01155 [Acidobacteriaceae bacterium]|nr:hypothetical protein [Acidobacteriaceae bacterium]